MIGSALGEGLFVSDNLTLGSMSKISPFLLLFPYAMSVIPGVELCVVRRHAPSRQRFSLQKLLYMRLLLWLEEQRPFSFSFFRKKCQGNGEDGKTRGTGMKFAAHQPPWVI